MAFPKTRCGRQPKPRLCKIETTEMRRPDKADATCNRTVKHALSRRMLINKSDARKSGIRSDVCSGLRVHNEMATGSSRWPFAIGMPMETYCFR